MAKQRKRKKGLWRRRDSGLLVPDRIGVPFVNTRSWRFLPGYPNCCKKSSYPDCNYCGQRTTTSVTLTLGDCTCTYASLGYSWTAPADSYVLDTQGLTQYSWTDTFYIDEDGGGPQAPLTLIATFGCGTTTVAWSVGAYWYYPSGASAGYSGSSHGYSTPSGSDCASRFFGDYGSPEGVTYDGKVDSSGYVGTWPGSASIS